MKKQSASVIGRAILILCLLPAHESLLGADMSIGVSARYSWWDPYWSQVSDTLVLPPIRVKSDFSGGPLLSIGINDTWGLFASYNFGEYTGSGTSFMLNPLFYYIEQPVSRKRIARRHDFSFCVSGRVNPYLNIVGGVVYSGYYMRTGASVLLLSYSHRIFHHTAGPSIGVDFSIPLFPGLDLHPACSAVFQFSKFAAVDHGAVSAFIDETFGGADTTLLYAGLKCALTLAYTIPRYKVTFALGGQFHYLWITDIDKGDFVADNRHDMFGGIHLTVMYAFHVAALSAGKTL